MSEIDSMYFHIYYFNERLCSMKKLSLRRLAYLVKIINLSRAHFAEVDLDRHLGAKSLTSFKDVLHLHTRKHTMAPQLKMM